VALEGAPAGKKGEKIGYVGYRSNIDEYTHDIGWFFLKKRLGSTWDVQFIAYGILHP
jgi:hypothetical protein